MDETLDLRILKTLSLDKLQAVDFASSYNFDLFNKPNHLFAKLFLGYVKGYRTGPTKRVLKEWAGEAYYDTIESTWDKLDTLDSFNIQEYPFDLEVFKKRYMKESLDIIKTVIENSDNVDPTNLLKDISLRIQNVKTIQNGKTYTQKTLKENVDDFEAQLAATIENPELNNRYIPTGYSGIDFACGGLVPAEFLLIGGETASGKSTLLFNLMLQIWMQGNTIETPKENFGKGFNVIYYSLEMPYNECFTRLIARMSQVPERTINEGTLNSEQRRRITLAEQFIRDYPYEFDIVDSAAGTTIEQVELRYNDALLKYKPDVCAIDYLGIMSGAEGNSEADWLKIGETAKEVHEFARVYNVPVASAVQLTDIQRNSQTDPKNKSIHQIVGPHRVGRSSQILHHATLGLQIESKPGDNESTFMTVHFIKNRRGPKINFTINKDFELSTLSDIQYVPGSKSPKPRVDNETIKPDLSGEIDKNSDSWRNNIINIKQKLGLQKDNNQ